MAIPIPIPIDYYYKHKGHTKPKQINIYGWYEEHFSNDKPPDI